MKIGRGVVPSNHLPLVPLVMVFKKVLALDVVRQLTKTPLRNVELSVQLGTFNVTSVG